LELLLIEVVFCALLVIRNIPFLPLVSKCSEEYDEEDIEFD
jgi:hypothetical protein